MYRILHLLLLLLFLDSKSFLVEGAKCTEALEMPDKSEDNRDTSGLRPNKLPPIAIGDTVTYQCPGMKSIKAQCLKITKNVAFEFFNFAISHQFLSY